MRVWTEIPYPIVGKLPDAPPDVTISSGLRTLRDWRTAARHADIRLLHSRTSDPRPLGPNEIAAIVVLRDEQQLIGPFLAHYRRLGIQRFLIVDDCSTDGTAEYLAQQPDVDLYTSNVRFAAANRGRLWRQMLVERYGRNRWYLSLDADEFLVFAEDEHRTVSDLVAGLEAAGIWHMSAPMLDMYPPGRISDANYAWPQSGMPWQVASLFDRSGYTLRGDERSWKITGGARERRFGTAAEVNKYPLVYWGRFTNINKSMHFAAPYWRNFTPPLGVLLHFKFFSDFYERFEAIAKQGQHFDQSRVYRQIVDTLGSGDKQFELECSLSSQFTGTADLIKNGFFFPDTEGAR